MNSSILFHATPNVTRWQDKVVPGLLSKEARSETGGGYWKIQGNHRDTGSWLPWENARVVQKKLRYHSVKTTYDSPVENQIDEDAHVIWDLPQK